MYIYVHMCICACAYTASGLYQSPSYFFLRWGTRSCIEAGDCCLAWTVWTLMPRDPPASAPHRKLTSRGFIPEWLHTKEGCSFCRSFCCQFHCSPGNPDAFRVGRQGVGECSQLAPGFFPTRCFQTSWGHIQVQSLLVFNSSLEGKQWVSPIARCWKFQAVDFVWIRREKFSMLSQSACVDYLRMKMLLRIISAMAIFSIQRIKDQRCFLL